MIACDFCHDTSACPSWTTASHPSVVPLADPVWESIRSEAIAAADREPVMADFLTQCVLDHRSIDESVAMLLSQRLHDHWIGSDQLFDELRAIVERETGFSKAVQADMGMIHRNDPAATGMLHPFLNFKGFLAIQAHRLAHTLWREDRRELAYHLQSRTSDVFGVDIHPAAVIGSGVFVDHGTGVVIGETAVVGDNVTMLHGVTLGGTGKQVGDRHPKVCNGVFIGAGAQLLGNIVIGNSAQIGASSVVLADVPPNCTVAGVPARIVRNRHDVSTAGGLRSASA